MIRSPKSPYALKLTLTQATRTLSAFSYSMVLAQTRLPDQLMVTLLRDVPTIPSQTELEKSNSSRMAIIPKVW